LIRVLATHCTIDSAKNPVNLSVIHTVFLRTLFHFFIYLS